MITSAKQASSSEAPTWHKEFLVMLPVIVKYARIAFAHLDREARQEVVQEVVCNALVAYHRLIKQGRRDDAFPSVLARFGIFQTRAGRKVGTMLNKNDVSSEYAQQQKGFVLERLDKFDRQENTWQEIVVEDRRATPADIAATRIDFAAWLKSLSPRMRRMATTLATGETTQNVARMFDVGSGRISQVRRELMESWQMFQGEGVATAQLNGAAA